MSPASLKITKTFRRLLIVFSIWKVIDRQMQSCWPLQKPKKYLDILKQKSSLLNRSSKEASNCKPNLHQKRNLSRYCIIIGFKTAVIAAIRIGPLWDIFQGSPCLLTKHLEEIHFTIYSWLSQFLISVDNSSLNLLLRITSVEYWNNNLHDSWKTM